MPILQFKTLGKETAWPIKMWSGSMIGQVSLYPGQVRSRNAKSVQVMKLMESKENHKKVFTAQWYRTFTHARSSSMEYPSGDGDGDRALVHVHAPPVYLTTPRPWQLKG